MHYDVVARLARGGMAVVDLAHGPDGRTVALKRVALYGGAADVAGGRRRIRREAEVLRSLHHPGLLPLLEVLDDGDDLVLVLPYLRRGSLADHVRAHGPLEPAAVSALAAPLLAALAAAHRAGVVHRDVKPGNVLFADDERPVLADFGVASSADVTAGLTRGDEVLGTPAFMAPEQARGDPVGPPSDVFGLGATLLWAATGAGPYGTGDDRRLVDLAAAGRVRRPPAHLPADLRRLLGAMLAPDPARRPSAAALVGGPAGTAVRAVPPLSGRAARRTGLALVAAVAVGALGAGLATWRAGAPDTAAADPVPAPCVPLPYQPCGAPPAPHTDGVRCVDDHDDYDGDASNGCEAAPDAADGATIERRLEANLVPADDVDRYRLVVDDRPQLLCDGTLRVTLTAPTGAAQRVEVLAAGEELGTAASTDGFPAVVELAEASCGGDDAATVEVRVSSIGSDRRPDPYRIDVRGSW